MVCSTVPLWACTLLAVVALWVPCGHSQPSSDGADAARTAVAVTRTSGWVAGSALGESHTISGATDRGGGYAGGDPRVDPIVPGCVRDPVMQATLRGQRRALLSARPLEGLVSDLAAWYVPCVAYSVLWLALVTC